MHAHVHILSRCADAHVCKGTCGGQRTTSGTVHCSPLTIFLLQTGSPPDLELIQQVTLAGQQSQGATCLGFLTLGLQACDTVLGCLKFRFGGLNSGSCACMVGTLLTELPSP